MLNKKELVLSVSESAALPAAKKLTYLIEKLYKNQINLSRELAGEIQLIIAPGPLRITKSSQLIIQAPIEKLLSTATYAILREFLGQLPLGETVVTYHQEQRGLLLDLGRKYYSKDIVFRLIDSMCLAQFNYLQLHFSENEGFRIFSESIPEVVSKAHLTKDEIREIILYAQQAGIEIIPDFDTPGHLKQVLQFHPEWQLEKKQQDGTYVKDPRALNICLPEAVDFVIGLYREFAELFADSTYFHIGGDEFVDFDCVEDYPELTRYAKKVYGPNASGIDTFVAFINRIIQELNHLGFIPRIWNDGFFRLNRQEQVVLAKEVEITYWTRWNQQMAPVSEFLDRGYQVVNFNDNYFYYVLGENAGYTYPTYQKIIESWETCDFPQQQVVFGPEKQLPGFFLSIWSDLPTAQSEEEVWQNISLLLFAAMQKVTKEVYASEEDFRGVLEPFFENE